MDASKSRGEHDDDWTAPIVAAIEKRLAGDGGKVVNITLRVTQGLGLLFSAIANDQLRKQHPGRQFSADALERLGMDYLGAAVPMLIELADQRLATITAEQLR